MESHREWPQLSSPSNCVTLPFLWKDVFLPPFNDRIQERMQRGEWSITNSDETPIQPHEALACQTIWFDSHQLALQVEFYLKNSHLLRLQNTPKSLLHESAVFLSSWADMKIYFEQNIYFKHVPKSRKIWVWVNSSFLSFHHHGPSVSITSHFTEDLMSFLPKRIHYSSLKEECILIKMKTLFCRELSIKVALMPSATS